MIEILIPTCQDPWDIDSLKLEIAKATPEEHVIFSSHEPASASVNRNTCLRWAIGDFLIMIDDDIQGFRQGWWQRLMAPLHKDSDIVAVSAYLTNLDGSPGETCAGPFDISTGWTYLNGNGPCMMPTAAMAMRNTSVRFDEGYIGSGWEDNDWFMRLRREFPFCKFAQSDEPLVHRNEMKHQAKYFHFNRNLFYEKWGKDATHKTSSN